MEDIMRSQPKATKLDTVIAANLKELGYGGDIARVEHGCVCRANNKRYVYHATRNRP